MTSTHLLFQVDWATFVEECLTNSSLFVSEWEVDRFQFLQMCSLFKSLWWKVYYNVCLPTACSWMSTLDSFLKWWAFYYSFCGVTEAGNILKIISNSDLLRFGYQFPSDRNVFLLTQYRFASNYVSNMALGSSGRS